MTGLCRDRHIYAYFTSEYCNQVYVVCNSLSYNNTIFVLSTHHCYSLSLLLLLIPQYIPHFSPVHSIYGMLLNVLFVGRNIEAKEEMVSLEIPSIYTLWLLWIINCNTAWSIQTQLREGFYAGVNKTLMELHVNNCVFDVGQGGLRHPGVWSTFPLQRAAKGPMSYTVPLLE